MQTELESLVSALRTVPFESLKLFPEKEDSSLDWPYKDKYSFHLQAYALQGFEISLNKTFKGGEFKQLFEDEMEVKAGIGLDSYFLNGMLLFTISLKEDASGNLYHYFQPKI